MKTIEINLSEDKRFSDYMLEIHEMSESELIARFPQMTSVIKIWKNSIPTMDNAQISIFNLLFEVVWKLKQNPNVFIIERKCDDLTIMLAFDETVGNGYYCTSEKNNGDILEFDNFEDAKRCLNTMNNDTFYKQSEYQVTEYEYYHINDNLSEEEHLLNYRPTKNQVGFGNKIK